MSRITKLRRWTGLCAVLALATACALAPSSAQAEQFHTQWVTSGYTGWSYVSTSAARGSAWKWTASGWVATSLAQGTPVWAAPFSGSWQWAWRSGTWYAVQTSLLGVWSCTPAPKPVDPSQPQPHVPIYAANTTASAVLGVMQAQVGDHAICSNPFVTASISKGNAQDVGPWCSMPPQPTDPAGCAPVPDLFVLAQVHVDPCATSATSGDRAGCDPTPVVRTGYARMGDFA